MSRTRRYGEDLTYAEEHRSALPELYGRIGHRIDVADRDWTEFCHDCKDPILLVEQVRDVGQNLRDKATTVTRKLARRAEVPAMLLAWRTERTAEAQAEIDALNRRIRVLEAAWPIVGFTARHLHPQTGRLVALTPDQWWAWLYITHRAHHANCSRPGEFPVRIGRLHAAVHEHPLHDGRLWKVAA